MRIVLAFALAVAPLPAAAQAAPDPVAAWRPLIAQAAARFALPEHWIERVMRAESAGMTMLDGRPIRSHAGAMGLMQLMPATWAEMRSRLGLGANPDNPHDNIMAGAAYLRLMYDRFGYPGLFAAYNAGPGRYSAYLAGRSSLPRETRGYLASVAGQRGTAVAAAPIMPGEAPAPPRQSLFVLRYEQGARDRQQTKSPTQYGLFAIRRDVP